ncbi:EamA family transporter [Agromyces indicus]|uniref:EamA family transporter n=1 Tax=Agromyces indicus TaxID=758919 RepID=A0ABU1FLP7_9MICO|nr:EamA family transporter [Agromyces indicus]MDR5692682.1 EamA family transporter [Agromyces indicus]
MLTAVLSLTGALVYGAADFLGGLAARRLGAVLATAVSAASGLVLLAIALPVTGGAWSSEAATWGALSGLVGAVAISLLYASLAIGPMSILSPLTALVSAITPMIWGTVVGGERFGPMAAWALGLALLAVVLVGFVPERGAVRPSARGLAFATGSGLAIGAFYILISQTPDDSGVVPLIFSRIVNTVLMFGVFGLLVLVARRASPAPALEAVRETTPRTDAAAVAAASPTDPVANAAPGPAPAGRSDARTPAREGLAVGFAIAIGCGLLDALANVLILLGIRAGDLAVAAVLAATYPAGTILLAAAVLRERIAPVQWAGLVLALAAAGMLALA